MRVAVSDVGSRLAEIARTAAAEPVTLTEGGQDRLVVLSIEEFRRLKRRDREVLRPHEFSDADLEAIRAIKPDPAYAYLDKELDGWTP